MPILPLQPGTPAHAGQATAAASTAALMRPAPADGAVVAADRIDAAHGASASDAPAVPHVTTAATPAPMRRTLNLAMVGAMRRRRPLDLPLSPRAPSPRSPASPAIFGSFEQLAMTPHQSAAPQQPTAHFAIAVTPESFRESPFTPFANVPPSPVHRTGPAVAFAEAPERPAAAHGAVAIQLGLRRLTPVTAMASLESADWNDDSDQAMETVMAPALWDATDTAIDKLMAKFTDVPPALLALSALASHIEAMADRLRKQASQTGKLPPLLRERGGDAEINNALRALYGAKRPEDISEAIVLSHRESELLAVVWHATGAPRPGVSASTQANETDVMRENLVMSLARCIEDDGHRVCGVGQRHRMVDVLKGFFPKEAGNALNDVTPQTVVTALAQEFEQQHETPTQAQIAAFKNHAQSVAQERFGADDNKMRIFQRDLNAYIDIAFSE